MQLAICCLWDCRVANASLTRGGQAYMRVHCFI